MALADRVEHVLLYDQSRTWAYPFSKAGQIGPDGWVLEIQSDTTVHIRWHFATPNRRDFELRTALLRPVAAFLQSRRFPVVWRRDQRGPYLSITDRKSGGLS